MLGGYTGCMWLGTRGERDMVTATQYPLSKWVLMGVGKMRIKDTNPLIWLFLLVPIAIGLCRATVMGTRVLAPDACYLLESSGWRLADAPAFTTDP